MGCVQVHKYSPAEPPVTGGVGAMSPTAAVGPRTISLPFAPQGCNVINAKLKVLSSLLGSRNRKC